VIYVVLALVVLFVFLLCALVGLTEEVEKLERRLAVAEKMARDLEWHRNQAMPPPYLGPVVSRR
jgi:hypothetical protein